MTNSYKVVLIASWLAGFTGVPQLRAQSNAIFACVSNATGQLRIPVLAAGSNAQGAPVCAAGETLLQWTAAGPVGPQGATGLAGLPGGHGPLGVQGSAGARGAMGATGLQGAAGTAGASGPQGTAGVTGGTGSAGVAGPAGAQGPQGPQGAAGLAGPDGAAGPQGTKGVIGAAGPTGTQGTKGPAGAQGAQGPAGATGASGPTVAGAQGATGTSGAAGTDGTMAPAGSISGTASCGGVPAAAGTLVYVPGRAFTAYTASDGNFHFISVPSGTYSVVIVRSGSTLATVTGVTVAASAVNLGTISACLPLPCGVTCSGTTPFCNTVSKKCVQCLTSADCKNKLAPICTSFSCGNGGIL
jgi:hypothetical protein